jgi:GNAT superfamily N-acetyltransferase
MWKAKHPHAMSVNGVQLGRTATDFRGQGLGRRVLDAVVDHTSDAGGGLLWCGARIRAVPFYERAGFSTLGDFYEEPVVGTHVLKWRAVAASTT